MWEYIIRMTVCWIILGMVSQTQAFSKPVKEGESVIIDCGVQTTNEAENLKWQAISNWVPDDDIAYDVTGSMSAKPGYTLYPNGSIELERVSIADGDKLYRCLRGDEEGYRHFSDHKLSVLSKESPTWMKLPSAANTFKVGKQTWVYSYDEPICEDTQDGVLRVTCSPASGRNVDIEYEMVHCNCTDSDGLRISGNISITREKSSPMIRRRDQSNATAYRIGILGVVHVYDEPICEDDQDGDLIVRCNPPPGKLMDTEHKTVNCTCIDSDRETDSLSIPVTSTTSLTENFHPGLIVFFVLVPIVIVVCVCLLIWREMHHRRDKQKDGTKSEREPLTVITPQAEQTEKESLADEVKNMTLKLTEMENDCKENKDKLKETEEERDIQADKVKNMTLKLTEMENDCKENKDKLIEIEKEKDFQSQKNKDLKGKLKECFEKEKTLAEKEVENRMIKEQLEDKDKKISSLEGKLDAVNSDCMSLFKQQISSTPKQTTTCKGSDNDDDFSSSGKQTKDDDSNRDGVKCKKKSKVDRTRRLTQSGFPQSTPEDDSPGSMLDDSGYNVTMNDEKDFDETDKCGKEYKLDLWNTYYIQDVKDCKGFHLSFMRNDSVLHMSIKLKVNEKAKAKCQFDFKNNQIHYTVSGKTVNIIDIERATEETVYELCLDKKEKKLVLSIKDLDKYEEWIEIQFTMLSILIISGSGFQIQDNEQLVPLER